MNLNHPARRAGDIAWQFGQILANRVERALRPFHLTLAQHNALIQAALAPGLTCATAARRTAITPQSMGTAVNGLVARGLLERRTTPGDRRTHHLYATEAGLRLAAQADAAVHATHAEVLEALTPAEQGQAHTLLLKLLASLNPAATNAVPAPPELVTPRAPHGQA